MEVVSNGPAETEALGERLAAGLEPGTVIAFTGDLGAVGVKIFADLLGQKGYRVESVQEDCGLLIYDNELQDTHSGGSGCGCSASTLAGYLLDKLYEGEWNRILFVPTGALLSPVSANEGSSIPGIAHAIVLERKQEVR